MATTTRVTLRQRLSEAIGDYLSVTSTSAGNTAATTIVSTELLDVVGGGDDDLFESWYVLVTSGNNDGERRRVRSYQATDSTVTVERAFSNATESGVTFEMHRHDPNYKNNAISRAIEELTRRIPQKIRDETIFIDSLLSNGDFETYSGGAFTGWTVSGSPAATQETSIVKQISPDDVPDNLVIRISSHMIDQGPVQWWPHTSTVVSDHSQTCPAPNQENKCQDCRSCWNKSVPTVSYSAH